jgi:RimJ/RimL family protein N-acetyltransferase
MKKSEIYLRLARSGDCRFLWQLRNEQAVRAQSFSRERIPYRDHCLWFGKQLKLNPERSRLYIIHNKRKSLGQIRFDEKKGKRCEVNIALSGKFRHKGYGRLALVKGMRRVLKDRRPLQAFVAMVKPGNKASETCFIKTGFLAKGRLVRQGQRAFRLECPVNFTGRGPKFGSTSK